MRRVIRGDVTYPARLQRLSAENLTHLNDHTKILSSIYAHEDVKNSLKELYFNKCYICECDVSNGKFSVEHYKPKKEFSQLGYTWSNLHKVCEKCNLAKEKKAFFFMENDIITDVKLLDPSSENYDINEYLRYNLDSMAEAVDIGSDPLIIQKARQTIDYLNGEVDSLYCRSLPYRRGNRVNNFLKFCMQELIAYKERIIEIKLSIDFYMAPNDMSVLSIDQHICHKLLNADQIYLSDRSVFSSCTKVNLYPVLGITHKELRRIVSKLRVELEI